MDIVYVSRGEKKTHENVLPVTVTRKRQVPEFPAESTAEQLTSVFPTLNVSFEV